MPQSARSALILGGLGLLLVVAGMWGWSATTEPFPGKTDPPKCVDTSIASGTKVFPAQVTVSVFNASSRNGLAGVTLQSFTDEGFAAGDTGNAPRDADVARVAIWTASPDNPDVQLVASRLGSDVRIVRRDPPGVGVSVIVGDAFEDVQKGRRSVRAESDTQICSPPVA